MLLFGGKYETYEMENSTDTDLTFDIGDRYVNFGIRCAGVNVVISRGELRIALSEVLDKDAEYFEFRDKSGFTVSTTDDGDICILMGLGDPVEYTYLNSIDARTLLNVLS